MQYRKIYHYLGGEKMASMKGYRLEPMKHFQLLANCLGELHHLGFAVLKSETGDDADDEEVSGNTDCTKYSESFVHTLPQSGFCEKNCFHPLQKEFTQPGLTEILQEMNPDTILHITDNLRIHTVIFTIDDHYIAMGPFCSLLFSRKDARLLITEHKLTSVTPTDFLSYASSYPFLSEEDALNIVYSILHSIYPEADDRPLVSITPRQNQDAEAKMDEIAARMNYALLLERRYAYEQNFRQNIMDGNHRAALLNLANMEQDVSYLKRIGSTLENEKIGAAITRTTARLAAMDGGLPGIVADQISNQNTKNTLRAKTVDEIHRAKKDMIHAYCAAIQEARAMKYSALVQSILYEMNRNFHKDFTLSELAEELAVSKNYLIQRFKNEVGQTPIQYLTDLRLKRAAILLAENKLSIQDIANAVGIPDANYFTKMFKKTYQMTPGQYRRSHVV